MEDICLYWPFYGATTLTITTLSITTHYIMVLNIMGLLAALSIVRLCSHFRNFAFFYCYAEWHYVECRNTECHYAEC